VLAMQACTCHSEQCGNMLRADTWAFSNHVDCFWMHRYGHQAGQLQLQCRCNLWLSHADGQQPMLWLCANQHTAAHSTGCTLPLIVSSCSTCMLTLSLPADWWRPCCRCAACAPAGSSRMSQVSLASNSISGPLTASWLALPTLALDLSNNRLSGNVPAPPGSNPVMRELLLGGNQLTGPLNTTLSRYGACAFWFV
jgi:hypothetical protein